MLMIRWLLIILFTCPLCASAGELNGQSLSLFWGLPFVGILLSIALGPIFCSLFWQRHFGKITLSWVLLLIVPFVWEFGLEQGSYLVLHAILVEFVPFILLLLALYTVSGGIFIKGNLHGSPKLNTTLLLIGIILASIMGTTGAAILLIRPLLRANDNRKHNVHVVIFFIFLVANIGGALTPLGDPPLFIGFLNGVDFFWTIHYLFLPVLFTSALLLIIFYLIDSYCYHRLDEIKPRDPTPDSSLCIQGKRNFLLLIAIIASVLISGIWETEQYVTILNIPIGLPDLVRNILLIFITCISLLITPTTIRAENKFNWEPMTEVAKLFIGIFVTIFPVLSILRAGVHGELSSLVQLVTDEQGNPINGMYFWLVGGLSSFLDNAPTYLVFFNLATGDAKYLMESAPMTLLAISAGSVFMGAMTYIGNAPNFMIRSIAIHQRVNMPSFFGYMKWSLGILVPIFVLLSFILF